LNIQEPKIYPDCYIFSWSWETGQHLSCVPGGVTVTDGTAYSGY